MADIFQYDVFISHSSKDKPVVRELANRLKKDGLRVWLDEWEIQPGNMIGLKIQQGLERSRTLLMIMSQAYFASEWSTLEHHTLLFRDPTNAQRRFIPLLIEDCKLPDVIAQFAYIDWREKSEEAYAKILAAGRPTEEPAVKSFAPQKRVDHPTNEAVMVLRGHRGHIGAVAMTSDGKSIISGSIDQTIRVWDFESGTCERVIKTSASIFAIVLADAKQIVAASPDNMLGVWDLKSGKHRLALNGQRIAALAILPGTSQRIVSGSYDGTVRIWDIASGDCLQVCEGHSDRVYAVATSPNGKLVFSGSKDGTLRVWDTSSWKCIHVFYGHTSTIRALAVTPDSRRVVSGSWNGNIQVWDLENWRFLSSFEGHVDYVKAVAVTPDGRQIISGADDKTVRVWDIESGTLQMVLTGHEHYVYAVTVSPNGQWIISGSFDNTVRVWPLPKANEIGTTISSERYANAKVVLVGESGVGKTGLAIRLVEDRWEVTDSTHGMNVWQLNLPQMKTTKDIEREVWFWDFAGQPDYRLIHQLYMDETALALMVIDPQRDNPFESLGHWEKALATAVKHEPAKLLIAGRCDRGGVTISRTKLAQYCQAHGYSEFLNTSAKTGAGLVELKAAIVKHIPWERLPWTATSRLFKTLKDAILRIKQEGIVLIRISELHQRLQFELRNEAIEEKALRAVVGLLVGQGLIRMLDFGDFVLLQPEQINNYASAVVRCARDNAEDIGCVSEREVLEARITFPSDMKRLNEADEKILLRAMVETFVKRALCMREETPAGTQLVFPSYFKQDRPEITEHPHVCVTYSFSGVLDEIYATLVVRLHYTNDFAKDQLWKYAADFTTLAGKRVGLQMTKKADASAEMQVYFEAGVHIDTQVSFIKYIHEHLRKRAKEVTRVRSYVCPHCDIPLENRKAIKTRLEKGLKDIICGACEERVKLIDMIEEKFASDAFLRAVQEMDTQAQIKLDNESLELILVGHAFSTAGEAGQIFRPTPNSDWGIDGEIEFKNDKGQASGRRVYLQLKSGDSYLHTRKSDSKEIFTIKNPRHAEYWQAHEYPVMLVIRTSDSQIRWMNVTDYLRRYGAKTKQIVFEGEPFTALNVARMRERVVKA